MPEPNVVIVVGRCCRQRLLYGMRLERQGDRQWMATWAFPLQERTATREHYDQTRIEGSFAILPTYPGCPHCQSRSFFRCGSCQRVSCWDGERRSVTCPWCSVSGELSSGAIQSLEAGTDR